MNLEEVIYKRKSCRNFKQDPLSNETLDEIRNFIDNTEPLFDDIETSYKITDESEIKSRVNFKAPHYLILFSKKYGGYLTNLGFIYQQLDLFLQSKGIGSCWVGMSKYKGEVPEGFEFVIMIYFGEAEGELYRDLDGFNRKSLESISDSPDEALKPALYAPSAINSQPWYFVHNEDSLDVYRVVHNFLKRKILEDLNKIDIGIALANLYVANKESFKAYMSSNPKELDGYKYMLTVNLG